MRRLSTAPTIALRPPRTLAFPSRSRSRFPLDAIAYDGRRGLLHVPSAVTGTMATIQVGALGELTLTGEVKTAKGASCVAVDDDGGVWVCDPAHGHVLSVRAH